MNSTLTQFWTLYSWRDGIELFCAISLTWIILSVLNQDQRRNWNSYFCGYGIVTFATWFFELHFLTALLGYALPVLVAYIMIYHQHSLQRALIMTPHSMPHETSDVWIDQIIKLSLHAYNRSISLHWIIEQQHALDGALQNGVMLQAPLSPELFDIIFAACPAHTTVTLWVDQNGRLSRLKPSYTPHLLTTCAERADLRTLPTWHQAALVMSAELDALTLMTHESSRLFTLVAHQKTIHDLSSQHARTLIKNMLQVTNNSLQEKPCRTSPSSAFAASLREHSGHSSSEQRPGG